MPPKNSGGSTKFPGGRKVIHRTAQTAFVRVVTPPAHPACHTIKITLHNVQFVHLWRRVTKKRTPYKLQL